MEGLVKSGVSYKRLEALGLEYKYIAIFLQKKMRRNDMEVELLREILRYVKRQMTWLKRMETQGWAVLPGNRSGHQPEVHLIVTLWYWEAVHG